MSDIRASQLSLSHETLFSVHRLQPKRRQNLCISLCCPCLILGHIESKIQREKLWRCTDNHCYPSITFTSYDNQIITKPMACGSSGCITCCQTGILSTCGYPFSPLLSVYIYLQRNYLRNIYEQQNKITEEYTQKNSNITKDSNNYCCTKRAITSCQDLFDSCCFRPSVLLQHLSYLNEKSNQGILFFEWEKESYLMGKKNQNKKIIPIIGNKIILIIGPHGCGKSRLFTKLLGKSYNKKSELLRDKNKTQTGVRCTSVTDDNLNFLEFWDIPEEQLFSSHVDSILSSVCAVLYVFDSTVQLRSHDDEEMKEGNPIENNISISSFEKMQNIYTTFERTNMEYLRNNDIKKLCIANRIDLIDHAEDFEKKIARMVQKKFHPVHFKEHSKKNGGEHSAADSKEHSSHYNRRESKANSNDVVETVEKNDTKKVENKNYDQEMIHFITTEKHKHDFIREKENEILEFAENWAEEKKLKYLEISSVANINVLELFQYLK